MLNKIEIRTQFVLKRTFVPIALSILIVTLIVLISIGVGFFGYLPASTHGTSMEPTLQDGDALLLKRVKVQDVGEGDIVALCHANEGKIAHRVIKIEPLVDGDYLLQTKGDANRTVEWWHIGAEEKIEIVLFRVRTLGNLLDFTQTLPGIVLLFFIGIVLLVMLTIIIRRYMLQRN